MPDDALGTAMWDYLHGEYDGTCVHRDTETGETWDANVGSFYRPAAVPCRVSRPRFGRPHAGVPDRHP